MASYGSYNIYVNIVSGGGTTASSPGPRAQYISHVRGIAANGVSVTLFKYYSSFTGKWSVTKISPNTKCTIKINVQEYNIAFNSYISIIQYMRELALHTVKF